MTAATRAAPFYCPYCSDESLRPFDPDDGSAGHGQWRCTACRRVFALRYIGLAGSSSSVQLPPEIPQSETPPSETPTTNEPQTVPERKGASR